MAKKLTKQERKELFSIKKTENPCFICVLDFEATCWNNNEHPDDDCEIIEFPSVLYHIYNDKIQKIDEFHEYVKPAIHPNLSAFCTELTGITQETVDKGDLFANVYSRHYNWIRKHTEEKDQVYFLSCGAWDLKTQLTRELENKKLDYKSDIYKKFINIKNDFKTFTQTKDKPPGMVGMLQHLNINLEGRHHSGIDDTRNISKIMLKLFENGYCNFKLNTV
jgi:ERI1 exoribonuclease 3